MSNAKKSGKSPAAVAVINNSTNEKTAELEAAYQALLIEHQRLRQAYDNIIHTTPDPKKLPPAGIPTETFEVDGETYRMAAANLHVKGVGKRTALEAMVDDTLYPSLGGLTILQWLVANNSTTVVRVSANHT